MEELVVAAQAAAATKSANEFQTAASTVLSSRAGAARRGTSQASVKAYFVYMMTNESRVVLYIGVTSDLERRVWEHQQGEVEGFTQKYRLRHLVYHETFHQIDDAIRCEKELKGWRRSKKNALVETLNPRWVDLSIELFKRL